MTRPQTVQDVFDAIRRDRLVEPARLNAFLDRHTLADVSSALTRLTSDGLLTAYQAGEVAAGRGAGLWLGSYRVLDRLGKGGMGHVFLAEHAVLGGWVGVMVLSDSLRADPGARRRFVREARAAATLNHPNIVHVCDVNMNNDPPYLVMDYVDGVSLQAAVSQTGTFSAAEAASVGVQVADGLARAAAIGLVHRDIKPANLLVDRHGAVKILDLGIVRCTHDDTHSRVHGNEVILGTLDYLAPEQAENSSTVDTRADLYALGATLYFLLAGHPPFPGTDVRRKLAAKQTEDPAPVHQLRPDVPEEFSAVVQRLMARDPADRYPVPAEVVAALHPWAVPGSDYPGRLFRLSSDSTAHGRRLTDHEPAGEPMPDTLRIIKPGARRVPAESTDSGTTGAVSYGSPSVQPTDPGAPVPLPVPTPPPTDEIFEAHAADTEGISAGAELTDEAMVVPPEVLALPDLNALLSAPTPAPAPAPECALAQNEPRVVLARRRRRRRRRRPLVGLVLAVAILAVVTALIWFAVW